MIVMNVSQQVVILFAIIFVIIAVIAVTVYHQNQLNSFFDSSSNRQLEKVNFLIYPICH
tara:strand:- start:223 stop:399 length:177 start_codon:yes stop_codon:yes gene_type:complete